MWLVAERAGIQCDHMSEWIELPAAPAELDIPVDIRQELKNLRFHKDKFFLAGLLHLHGKGVHEIYMGHLLLPLRSRRLRPFDLEPSFPSKRQQGFQPLWFIIRSWPHSKFVSQHATYDPAKGLCEQPALGNLRNPSTEDAPEGILFQGS